MFVMCKKSVLMGIFIVILYIIFICIDTISEHDLTQTTIALTEIRIRMYWQTHGKLPSDLTNLPVLPGKDVPTKDAWGKELKYTIQGNKVTLSSPGKSGSDSKRNSGFTNTFDVSDNGTEWRAQ
jgi:hypothetical protein